ncbi:hypothetical protein T484DRAFT_1962999 [Baffinella frigidus]|nr:hypothetical protein T484DRAFT_1962999 [Cryptophyta sp. CCMP2293]
MQGFGLRVSGLWVRVSGFGFRVSGFGFRFFAGRGGRPQPAPGQPAASLRPCVGLGFGVFFFWFWG